MGIGKQNISHWRWDFFPPSVLTREGWYDENARSMLTCLDLSVEGAANPMMQLKVTALMAAELCVSIMWQCGDYSAAAQQEGCEPGSLKEPTLLPR